MILVTYTREKMDMRLGANAITDSRMEVGEGIRKNVFFAHLVKLTLIRIVIY